MRRKKSNLGEMQEQELLKVEHNGCWIAFWGLLAAIIIQSILFGSQDCKTLAGEGIVVIWKKYQVFSKPAEMLLERMMGVFGE